MSNIELLRIISMMMVLALHIDGASLGLPSINGNLDNLNVRSVWKLSVESLAIVGVNCFTLISGYFSIKLKWKSVGIYLFQCLFYSLGIYLIFSSYDYFINHDTHAFTLKKITDSLMILTHTDLWYVPAYFMLMLLAPFINAGFECIQQRKLLIIVGILIVFNIWGGWYWGGKFNPTGYTVMQLIMMYCIGRLISGYKNKLSKIKRNRSVTLFALIYLAATLITAIGACYNPSKAFAYNQPCVIIASVALFMYFERLQFESSVINYAAKSAFAVYLIHKTPLIWVRLIRPSVIHLWNTLSLSTFTLAAILIIITIYLIAMLIDPIRRSISSRIFR